MELIDDVPRFTATEEQRFQEEMDNPVLAALRDHWAEVERITAILLGKYEPGDDIPL